MGPIMGAPGMPERFKPVHANLFPQCGTELDQPGAAREQGRLGMTGDGARWQCHWCMCCIVIVINKGALSSVKGS